MLTIVGGTYVEYCIEPLYKELYGSGLRAACALSGKNFSVRFYSCVGREYLDSAEISCATFDIEQEFKAIAQTVSFEYEHPLSPPNAFSEVLNGPKIQMGNLKADNVLYYGLIEATINIEASRMVYDPQNGVAYRDTGCKAEELALVLNKKEALSLSGLPGDTTLSIVGKKLLGQEGAAVVVIKNGPNGGLVVDQTGGYAFPVYQSKTVWPIGSGDIFSAAFAWKWMMERLPAKEAAVMASQHAADYCGTQILPLAVEPMSTVPLERREKRNTVYLAAPFFTMAERWLVRQIRKALQDCGTIVFSPLHDVDIKNNGLKLTNSEIASLDLKGLQDSDVIFAVANGIDPGTLFEVGYGIAKGKRVIVFVENINPNDLTMLSGTDCEIVSDFATAVYKASW